ncbi:hypothetical protein OEZ85_002175 [Tetradesmus obliquus]|uniref:HD/PDEase domain-containing protein n=1 Tax=Tetradesmus obliquus TaxID=3088 RepID=A0ABY8U6D3_TETOB|nr:hypothetical protein OEZ85_002175 [Tetradesmus obliquus]
MPDLLDELQSLSVSEYSSRRRDTAAGASLCADVAHGEVAIDECASQLLHTRPFRRMDSLKQLGCANWVFPGATHTRHQHSLGVSHLAVECGMQLHRNGAKDVTAEDLMLLGVAGLLHDVGHGPFSHVFESQILPRLGVTGWKHEDMSEQLIDHIADSSSLDLSQQQWGRVKDIIRGRTTPGNFWAEGQEWLPSVVAGDADMDRGDYLMRDAVTTGMQHNYDVWELIRASKVLEVDGVNTICYAESAQSVLAAQFEARALMHDTVYQQQQVKAVECMVADALTAANHVLRIQELASSASSFLALSDDSLLGRVRQEGILLNSSSSSSSSSHPSLRQAAAILARADAGDYYPMAAELDVTGWDPRRLSCSSATVERQLAGYCQDLTAEDIRVVIAEIGHGRKQQDPLAFKLLYAADLNTRPAHEGLQRPVVFSKRLMRMYLAKDCQRNAALINRSISQLQAALQRLMRERADSPQQQQQQQQQDGLFSSRSTSSSMSLTRTLTPLLSQLSQAQLPFAHSQPEEQQ